MSELNIETLKQIVEKLPDDFIVEFEDINDSTHHIQQYQR